MGTWSERYSYTKENIQKYAPTSGGVYRLINKDGDNFYVFYVGQSENLEKRLLEHLSANEPNSCIKKHLQGYSCFFRFIGISSSEERDKVEKEQIQEYNPSCNKST